METLELFNAASNFGLAGVILLVGLLIWRSREKTELASDSNVADSLDIAKSTMMMFGDLSANIKASTETLVALNKMVTENNAMLDGFRREVQGVHGSQIEALRNIQQTMVLIPDLAAGKVREDLGPMLADIKCKLEAASLQIVSACLRIDELATLKTNAKPAVEANAEPPEVKPVDAAPEGSEATSEEQISI